MSMSLVAQGAIPATLCAFHWGGVGLPTLVAGAVSRRSQAHVDRTVEALSIVIADPALFKLLTFQSLPLRFRRWT